MINRELMGLDLGRICAVGVSGDASAPREAATPEARARSAERRRRGPRTWLSGARRAMTWTGPLFAVAVVTAVVAGCAGENATTGTPTRSAPSTTVGAAATAKLPDSYAHPEVLTDVAWVSDHLTDPSVRILDARMPLDAALYFAGHIPGAVYVDVFKDICCPSALMPGEAFEKVMGRLGVSDDTTVVVYDSDGGLWAARVWWALRYFGHEQVKMLDGGLRQWVSAGNALDTAAPQVNPALFHTKLQPPWRATTDEVRNAIDDPAIILLDALPRPSYTGDLVLYGRAGHIPTAVSFPFSDTIDGVTQKILAPEVLARMLTRLHLDPHQRVITYCGGGNSGAQVAFVLYLMGFDKVGLYDGSLMQWVRDPSNPMETTP